MEETQYIKILEKAYENLPEVVNKTKRFNIPEVRGRLIKTRTQITNFVDIAKELSREPEHMFKFFLKEVGVRGDLKLDRGEVILFSRFQPGMLNKAVESYFNSYVKCPKCTSPDTTLSSDGISLKCKACGHLEKVSKL